MSIVDRLVVGRRLRLAVQCLEHLILEPWPRFGALSLCVPLSSWGSYLAVARQIEAGELADHGIAAHPDFAGNLAAGKPGLEAGFQEFQAFGSPGAFVGGHGDGPKLRVVTPTPFGPLSSKPARPKRSPFKAPCRLASCRCRGSQAARP